MEGLILFALRSQFDASDLSALSERLPVTWLDRARRHGNPDARATSLLAYSLLLYGVRRMLGDRALPSLSLGEHGKPFFSEGGLSFSITHTKNAVAVLLSRTHKELGLDLEEIRPLRPSLTRKFASDAELAKIESSHDGVALWTKKEAVAKQTGIGLRGDLRSIPTDDTRTVSITLGDTRSALSVSPAAALTEETRLITLSPSELLNDLCSS